jgi:hypothetical protein
MLLSFTLSLLLPAHGKQFHRRQADDTDPCFNTTSAACSWLQALDSCSTSDTTCFCLVINSASASEISACASCEQSVNATLAQEISESGTECASYLATAPAPTPATTAPGTTTPLAPAATTEANSAPVTTHQTIPTTNSAAIGTSPNTLILPTTPAETQTNTAPVTTGQTTPTTNSATGGTSTNTTLVSTTPAGVTSSSLTTSTGGIGLSSGAIGGIVGGILGAAFLSTLAVLIVFLRNRGKRNEGDSPTESTDMPGSKELDRAGEDIGGRLKGNADPENATEVGGRLQYPDDNIAMGRMSRRPTDAALFLSVYLSDFRHNATNRSPATFCALCQHRDAFNKYLNCHFAHIALINLFIRSAPLY